MVLCLLAALFAIEAKVAWFGPEGSAVAQVSAAKLQPADAPRMVAQALSSSALPLLSEVSEFLAMALLGTVMHLSLAWTFRVPEKAAAPNFSPSLFFRPPPEF